MSGLSSTSSATGAGTVNQGTLGDAPPVSFPGVASGIDYTAIIEKYTAITLEQERPLQSQVSNITAENTAVLKIKNLIANVQDTLTNLSDPNLFTAYKANISNTASGSPAATATQIAGETPLAGNYIINAQTAATSTTVANSPSANAGLNTTPGVALDAQGTAVTPSNGSGGTGEVTINGVQVSYDVTTQSLATILAKIQTDVPGVTATYNAANGTVTLTGVTSLGSGGDSGNLLSVLKLDSAQLVGGNITSSSSIAGIDANVTLNQSNNAGFALPVTAGTFTINGVQFNVNPATQSLSDVINAINASSAGVLAQYNTATAGITLTATTPGPQSILLGATSDTSNFLAAVGLTSKQDALTAGVAAGATAITVGNGALFQAGQTIVIGAGTANAETATILNVAGNTINLTAGLANNHNSGDAVGFSPTTTTGTQASVTYTNPSGVQQQVFSSTDSFNNVIPGFTLNVTSSGGAPGSTFYTVNVASDPTQAESAINKFITAYNAAITEINKDTVAPTVSASTGSNGTAQSSSSGGGVLYGNFDIENLKTQLVNLVSGFVPSGSQDYNSLASVGLVLSTASETLGVKDDSNDTTDAAQQADDNANTYTTANGLLSALDTTTFEAAYAANTTAVSNLFTLVPPGVTTNGNTSTAYNADASQGFSYLFGNYLANVNGITTFLKDTALTPGDLNAVLLTTVLDANNQQIDSLNQQIDTITSEANNQANSLRTEFASSESQIAELQSLQEEIAAIGH